MKRRRLSGRRVTANFSLNHEIVRNQSGKPVEETLVWLAIDQLNENNLLAKKIQVNFNGQTRREVIKKIGLAAVISLPIVSSLVAPTAAYAVFAAVCNRVKLVLMAAA